MFFIFSFIIPFYANAKTIYISTTGNDGYNGSSETLAIASIKHAYQIMSPGDILEFMDGIYNQQLYPPVSLSGSDASYTIFRAKNPGKVIIAPKQYNSTEAALYVYSSTSLGTSHHMMFQGFHVIGYGETFAIRLNSQDNISENLMTSYIIIKQTGCKGSSRDYNNNAFEVSNVKNTLIEDVYAYGFGRKAFEVFGCRKVTVRRAVVRYDWWEGDSYKPNDPRNNFTAYNTIDSVFENIISFDAGPNPVGVSSDRSGITASGNTTAVSSITGSSNNGYYGCVVMNNNPPVGIHNGIMVNGGTGLPASNISFKDIVVWGEKSYGVTVHDNANGVYFSNITISNSGLTGLRINDYPAYKILDVSVKYSVSMNNKGYGFYNVAATNSSSIKNSNADLEASYVPTFNYLPTNTPKEGYVRGADVTKKYVNGVKTTESLWPWPNEDIIKHYMCDEDDLGEISSAINAKNGSSIIYSPGLCSSGKSLTRYVWEYLGTSIPSGIYAVPGKVTWK